MKKFVLSLCIMIMLTSCSTNPFSIPINTPTMTSTSTSTPRPTATVTPTIEPTQSPQQISAELGLDQKRTYLINDNYIIDQFNLAPKAILKGDGTWRLLDMNVQEDREIMYGNLVPQRNYIDTSKMTMRYLSGFDLYSTKAIYLGDVIIEEKPYKDGFVQVPFLLLGLRDLSGQIRLVKYGYDAVGIEPEHWTDIFCVHANGNGTGESVIRIYHDLYTTISSLKPGQVVRIDVYNPQQPFPTPYLEYDNELEYPQFNNSAIVMMTNLTKSDIENVIAFNEWNSLKDGVWPERILSFYNRLELWEPCDVSD